MVVVTPNFVGKPEVKPKEDQKKSTSTKKGGK